MIRQWGTAGPAVFTVIVILCLSLSTSPAAETDYPKYDPVSTSLFPTSQELVLFPPVDMEFEPGSEWKMDKQSEYYYSPESDKGTDYIPEPATMLLFGAGIAYLAAMVRSRTKKVNRAEEKKSIGSI